MTGVSHVNLPPEFNKALEVAIQKFDELLIKRVSSQELTNQLWTTTGFSAFTRKQYKIREIPSGDGWRWNQAKHRYTISDTKYGAPLSIIKLVPRKAAKSSLDSLPKLKLWLISMTYKKYSMSIFWCEKGADLYTPQEELNLKDYAFLAPFMDPLTSKELFPTYDIHNRSFSQEKTWQDLLVELIEE